MGGPMNRLRSSATIWRVAGAMVAALLVAGACGDSGGKQAAQDNASGATSSAPASTLAPQRGGVVTVGQFASPAGLDPAKSPGTSASVGGMELAAIYDTIMRLDPATGKYEPRTAQSLTPNADFSEWTLKLKPGIKFTDGTDYNADAVKFSIDREMSEGNPQVSAQLKNAITSVTVVDPLTVSFKLRVGWSGFPYLISTVGGMVYSKAAFEKAGANFNVAPGDAGAGPFKVKSYKPGEALELERNPNYYGGDVYLDGLRFILLAGPAATFEGLKAGTLQAAFIRDPAIVDQAKSSGFGTVIIPSIGGSLMVMNSGVEVTCAGGKPDNLCAGKPDGEKVKTKTPTSDVRVRQAVAQSIDVKVVNDRVYQGKATATNAPFFGTPFDPKVPGPKYDLEQAKKLVQQAKSDGWDGKIRVLAGNDPTSSTWAITVSTMMKQAGMDVQTDTSKPIADVIPQVLVARDFDTVSFGLGLTDEFDGNYTQMVAVLSSSSPRYGYGTPELDAAMDLLRTADTLEKRTEASKKVSEILVRDVPVLFIANLDQALVASPKLHGAERNAQQNIVLNKAWLEK